MSAYEVPPYVEPKIQNVPFQVVLQRASNPNLRLSIVCGNTEFSSPVAFIAAPKLGPAPSLVDWNTAEIDCQLTLEPYDDIQNADKTVPAASVNVA